MSNKLETVEAKRVFREVLSGLQEVNVIPYLIFGTLLGYYRECGFIVGDDDIDLGILECERERVVSALNYYVNETGAHYTEENDGVSFIQIIIHGVNFSFSVFKPSKGLWRSSDWLLSDTEINTAKEEIFFGRKVKVFSNADAVLSRLYGDWRIPKKIKACWYEDRSGPQEIIATVFSGDTILEYSVGSDIMNEAKYIKVKHSNKDTEVRQACNKFGFLCIGEQDGEMLFRNIR